MTDTTNPYRAPDSRVADIDPVAIVPAERWRRFVNLIIDYFGFVVLSFVIGVILGIAGLASTLRDMGDVGRYVFGIVIMVVYYTVQEAMFGRTLGKLVTGTKVVDAKGNRITPKQALFRTLSRFIPFEAFTFFASDARGLHDKLPGTYVVKTR